VIDLGRDDCSEECDWWNWRPTVALLRASGLLDDVQLVLLDSGAGEVSEGQARDVARFLEERVFPAVGPDERVLLDGAVIAAPDDGTFRRDPSELLQNYSASGEWLRRFAEFCRECRGFSVR
jgi:hypothetical protein